MPYYFKSKSKNKTSQNQTLSPPGELLNSDYKTILPYLVALKLHVCFILNPPKQAILTPTMIYFFESNRLTLSNQIIVDPKQIVAIILSFDNTKTRQKYMNAFAHYLDLSLKQHHKLKPTFEYLRTNNQKITSIYTEENEIFSTHPYKTIQRGGYSTIFLSYEKEQNFYFGIVSLNHMTSFNTVYII